MFFLYGPSGQYSISDLLASSVNKLNQRGVKFLPVCDPRPTRHANEGVLAFSGDDREVSDDHAIAEFHVGISPQTASINTANADYSNLHYPFTSWADWLGRYDALIREAQWLRSLRSSAILGTPLARWS
jgi:hypothetical protein